MERCLNLKISKRLQNLGINAKHIISAFPLWGGFHESMVGTAKLALKKC